MESTKLDELLKLPVDERLRLIDALWESLRESPEAMELTPAQREELDRRWRAYEADPDAGSPWPVLRDRIISRR
jgi:putative addiction module component (TIGR02574 family)